MDFDEILTFIIAYSGDSISSMMEAIELARKGDFIACDNKMEAAQAALLKAHDLHTQLLVKEATQGSLDFSLLMVHVATHLANAEMTSNMATCFIKLYKNGKENA